MSPMLDKKLDELSDEELWQESRLLVSNRRWKEITPRPWERRLDIILSIASLLFGVLLSVFLTALISKL